MRAVYQTLRLAFQVLLFSQFTETLDLIQDWTDQIKKIPTFRLDGQTSSEDRRMFMKDFNEGTGPDCMLPILYLD